MPSIIGQHQLPKTKGNAIIPQIVEYRTTRKVLTNSFILLIMLASGAPDSQLLPWQAMLLLSGSSRVASEAELEAFAMISVLGARCSRGGAFAPSGRAPEGCGGGPRVAPSATAPWGPP